MLLRLKIILKRLKYSSSFGAWLFEVIASFCRGAHVVRGLLSWLVLGPARQMLPAFDNDRRILIIYDLSGQSFGIGDILLFQEVSLVLLDRYEAKQVDFALVYNPQRPAAPDPVLATITEENCLYHLASILPAAQVNRHLGSLFLFNSHDHLERYVANNINSYSAVWPSAKTYLSREYLFYQAFNVEIANYYREHKQIPHLHSRDHLLSWADVFIRERVSPSAPVTVQLRRNRLNPDRNSNYDVWLEFFLACNERYPAKFIIIGTAAEMDERFRLCPNVLMAKDFFSQVEHDLALINRAVIHMGASSGPGTLAMFGDKPYLLINSPADPLLKIGFAGDGIFLRAFFAGPNQQVTIAPETLEMLLAEFEKMWGSLDQPLRAVANPEATATKKDYSWLR